MNKVNLSYYIGVCVPCGYSKKYLSVSKDIDYLSPDLLCYPSLQKMVGMSKREAIKEYKLLHNIKRMGVLY